MPIYSKFRVLQMLFSKKQQKSESLTDFSNRFFEQLKMMEACNGSLVDDGVRNYIARKKYKQDYSTLNTSEWSKIELSIKNFAEATLFLMMAGGNAALVRQELDND